MEDFTGDKVHFEPASQESAKCIDCGKPLNEGEAKTFTCCDDCWEIAYASKPQSAQSEGPYKVEVDDNSDDCGTVYVLKGPNVQILGKDEEWLKERMEDFNLAYHSRDAEVERLKADLKEAMRLLDNLVLNGDYDHSEWDADLEALKERMK